jgi:hypothetical protein
MKSPSKFEGISSVLWGRGATWQPLDEFWRHLVRIASKELGVADGDSNRR